MKPYEKVVYKNRGAPGNSYVVTLFFDPAASELKVRAFLTRYKGTRMSKETRSVPDFLSLKDPRWPNMYKLPQRAVRKALLDLMIKGGAEQVEDINAHRT